MKEESQSIRRAKWLMLALVAVLIGAAAGALSMLWQRPPASSKSAATVAPVAAGSPAGGEISLPGKVRARHTVPVPAPIDGTMHSVEVEIGQEVFEGQVLGRIENLALQSSRTAAAEEADSAQERVNILEGTLVAARLEASRASADASRARSEFERVEKIALRQQLLHREGATPRLVYEKAQKEFEIARADYETLRQLAQHANDRVASLVNELDAARRTLEDKRQALEQTSANLTAGEIHSPADGILVTARANAGDPVNPAMEDLFRIAVDLSELEVVVEPDPPTLARIRQDQAATIRIAEMPSEAIPGTVGEIKDGNVAILFRNPSPVIRPGLTAQVRIKLP